MSASDAAHAARARGAVNALLPSNVTAAEAKARAIVHPWYRCQALTAVAAHVQGRVAERLLRDALAAARQLTEANRIVTVASWPMSLLSRQTPEIAQSALADLVATIQAEPHTLRRAHALLFLFEAVYPHVGMRQRVFGLLWEALELSRGWRAQRLMRFTALVVAADDPARALELVDQLGDTREARRTRRDIAGKVWLGPHEFVPYYRKRGAAQQGDEADEAQGGTRSAS